MKEIRSTKKQVKLYAIEVLGLDGIDPTLIDLRKEGITLASFSKLADSLYELGYRDGIEQRASAQKERHNLELTGQALTNFNRFAKYISSLNLKDK